MNKSIYEEAYLILNGRIADGEVKSFKVTGTTYCKITNALKQAQKQEELLKLYKELSIKERKRAISEKTRNVDEYNQSSKEIETLEKIIGEFENDKL